MENTYDESQLDAAWKREVKDWWANLTPDEKAAWLADKPHIPFVAVSSDGYWGRGHTQEEAVKQMRAAGFRGKTTKKAILFVMPPSLLDGAIDYMGSVTYFVHPEIGYRTDKPQRVAL